jgi:hypothetical protein
MERQMTRPELRKLDNVIKGAERLYSQTDDAVARTQLYSAIRELLSLYNSAKRDCDATERA